MKLVFVSAVAIMLSGCGGWSRPNTSEAEFNADRYACESQAAQSYPVQMMYTPGPVTPSQTTCQSFYGQVRCTTTPGVQYPGTQTDMNSINRASAIRSCLQSKGYTWGNKTESPSSYPVPPMNCTNRQVDGQTHTFCNAP